MVFVKPTEVGTNIFASVFSVCLQFHVSKKIIYMILTSPNFPNILSILSRMNSSKILFRTNIISDYTII